MRCPGLQIAIVEQVELEGQLVKAVENEEKAMLFQKNKVIESIQRLEHLLQQITAPSLIAQKHGKVGQRHEYWRNRGAQLGFEI